MKGIVKLSAVFVITSALALGMIACDDSSPGTGETYFVAANNADVYNGYDRLLFTHEWSTEFENIWFPNLSSYEYLTDAIPGSESYVKNTKITIKLGIPDGAFLFPLKDAGFFGSSATSSNVKGLVVYDFRNDVIAATREKIDQNYTACLIYVDQRVTLENVNCNGSVYNGYYLDNVSLKQGWNWLLLDHTGSNKSIKSGTPNESEYFWMIWS